MVSDPLDRFAGFYELMPRVRVVGFPDVLVGHTRHIVTAQPTGKTDSWGRRLFRAPRLCGEPAFLFAQEEQLRHMYPDDDTSRLCSECVAAWRARTGQEVDGDE